MINLHLERVYQDDGTELNTAQVPTSIAGVDQMLYDGRYVWVTCTSGIAIYEFWGASSDNEPTFEELDELVYARYDSGAKKKLRLVTFMSLGAQLQRVTRHASLSLRPDILSTTPDGATTVGDVTATLTTIRSDLRVVTEVSTNSLGSLSPKWIAKIGRKIYVTNGANFTKIFEFDADTQRPVRTISLPMRTTSIQEVANSNLCAAGGYLWMANTFYDDGTLQKLYRYDLTTFTALSIPVRPQSARMFIVDGHNGHVYFTNFNNVSISKVSYDNTFVSAIRTNALPTQMWSDQNRRIWVNSYAGMLTLVDYDDDGVHNDWSTDDAAQALAFDPSDSTKLWWCDGAKLVKHDLTTKTQLETSHNPDETDDWFFDGSFPAGNVVSMISVPSQVIGYDGGEKTMAPYLILGFDNHLACIRLDTYLMYRKSYAELNGQGAVVAGSVAYFGEQ